MAEAVCKCFVILYCIIFYFDAIRVSGIRIEPSISLHFPEEVQVNDPVTISGQSDFEVNRVRRDVSGNHFPTKSNAKKLTPSINKLNDAISVFELKDGHNQLIVHWAGKGSDVVVCLARDFKISSNSSSSVYFSNDYGKSYNEKQKEHMKLSNQKPAVINKFYNSRADNSRYIFTDVVNKHIFMTKDYGISFFSSDAPCKPDLISLNPSNPDVILMMETNDKNKVLYGSEDFGETWREVQQRVKSFFWGVEGIDSPNTLFVERQEPTHHGKSKSTVIRSDNYFKKLPAESFIANVEDFEVRNEYMFATKRQKLFGSKSPNASLELWVSYNREPFHMAIFPNDLPHQDYYVADTSEKQVFVCVNHDDLFTNLYLSDVKGLEYTLSLERILYFNPQSPNGNIKDMWLSFIAKESFADFYKVDGVRGIYIATQIKDVTNTSTTVKMLSFLNFISLITFDKGSTWSPITPPKYDSDGDPLNCDLRKGCSLHLTQKFSQLYPEVVSLPILARKSAPGLILATGVLGSSLKGHPEVYLSSDAGLTWHQVLKENYFYVFGDHGGIIVATKFALQAGETNEIVYSIDEGNTWDSMKFTNEKIRVYGLMVEPGEKTTIFTLFGSRENMHEWLLFKIDLKRLLGTYI
ncbi:Sortilin-related receptor [Nymphon striatum]|nr:Sortilin-related receptor [Nymphon striatum]